MRTVRGIECFEQSDLCKNTNIADAVRTASIIWGKKSLENIQEPDSYIGAGFEIDFIPEGKRKPIRHMILTSSTIRSANELNGLKEEILNVFADHGVRVHYNKGEWVLI